MSDAVVLGIDGGGSKTLALVANLHSQVVGRGIAGTSNYQTVGTVHAWQALEAATMAALRSAQRSTSQIRAVCLGLAGVDRPADVALVYEWATQHWPAVPVVIVNDAQLALAAGTPAGWGVALIAGTGSIAYGRSQDDRSARAGGWGYLLGDEGSGYAIGLAALRSVARAADGRGPGTTLTSAILAHWGLAAPPSLIQRVYIESSGVNDIANLAQVVARTAEAGDAVAQEIMHAACRELALAAHSVVRQLELHGQVPCALAGGLLVNLPMMTSGLIEAAQQIGMTLDPLSRVTEPALGAVKLAMKLVDNPSEN